MSSIAKLLYAPGGSIRRILLSPDFYVRNETSEKWVFDGYKFGQPLHEAKEKAGEKAVFFHDELEVSGKNYDARIYFERRNGESQAWSMDISIN